MANAGSDDVSVCSLRPLQELARVRAGREPFAVAAAPDGSRVYVANRLAVASRPTAPPVSEVTVLDPARARRDNPSSPPKPEARESSLPRRPAKAS